ncbi:unnamed protein product [Prorocentrum cordatum]|uniref:PDZ domain-containing protein n=1 Tax=Prorocentrum cordatum TaxID=2364126 RepID=A0ABN9QVT3_9DINO|nr:unnamed protein product [Polarella glacialis]
MGWCGADASVARDVGDNAEAPPGLTLDVWCLCCASEDPGVPAESADIRLFELARLDNEREEVAQIAFDPIDLHADLHITVRRFEGESLGLELDLLDGRTMQICEVKQGAVDRINRKELPRSRVQPGDFIVGVDGVEGDAQLLLQTLQGRQTEVSLRIVRPAPFNVNLQRRDAADGFGVVLKSAAGTRSISLVVAEVLPGILADWNAEHPDAAIQRLDRIIQVNHISYNPEQMLRIFKEELRLRLQVVRPA